MKLKITKKKLGIILTVMGLVMCVSTLVTLKILSNIFPASAHPTDAVISSPENAISDSLGATSEIEGAPNLSKQKLGFRINNGENGYLIEVNRKQNVVMVYALDQNKERSDLIKTFVASVGLPTSETIVGTFNTSDKYEALYLVGDVWGRYAVRIDGPYFFHSVPYFSKGGLAWGDLEYLEYNKLGEPASAGCVRLSVEDAKWIYDNIPTGTEVKIYDDDKLPDGVTKPKPTRIDEKSPYRGWDPTDPNPDNPWLKLKEKKEEVERERREREQREKEEEEQKKREEEEKKQREEQERQRQQQSNQNQSNQNQSQQNQNQEQNQQPNQSQGQQ